MDSFDFDNVKAEKANAIRRFNRLRSIAFAFRTLEVALALVLLSWIFNRLPFAVKISGQFFRRMAGVVASPFFVFVLSNGIIVALIAKSGENHNNAETELYEEIIKNSGGAAGCNDRAVENTKATSLSTEESESRPGPYTEEGEIVYQDKQIISEVNTCRTTTTIALTCEDDVAKAAKSDTDSDMEWENNPRVYRRSKSEKLEVTRKREKVLRRIETEKYGVKCGELFATAAEAAAEAEENLLYPEDELSNEEFQRTIEEFIAKQLKFRRQESMSMAIVLQNQS